MRKLAILALAIATLPHAPAMAQNVGGTPVFGATTLNAGFTPDPRTVNLSAGGPNDAAGLGGQCIGMIGESPDYRLTYTAGQGLPLYIRATARGSADLSLAVNGPDGRWHCNDDTHGLNPEVSFSSPQSGVYDIYVGTIGQNGNNQAVLSISEIAL